MLYFCLCPRCWSLRPKAGRNNKQSWCRAWSMQKRKNVERSAKSSTSRPCQFLFGLHTSQAYTTGPPTSMKMVRLLLLLPLQSLLPPIPLLGCSYVCRPWISSYRTCVQFQGTLAITRDSKFQEGWGRMKWHHPLFRWWSNRKCQWALWPPQSHTPLFSAIV